jgi:hypothetical protein
MLGFGAGPWLAAPESAGSEWGNPSTQDRAFIALQNAYRPYAGLLRLPGRLPARVAGERSRSERPARDVEGLVDAGLVFGFPWHDALWLPMFQFDVPLPAIAAVPRRVVAELGGSFDGWEIAGWFVQPNSWLAGQRPIDCLASRLPEVLNAARADRFVAAG